MATTDYGPNILRLLSTDSLKLERPGWNQNILIDPIL